MSGTLISCLLNKLCIGNIRAIERFSERQATVIVSRHHCDEVWEAAPTDMLHCKKASN